MWTPSTRLASACVPADASPAPGAPAQRPPPTPPRTLQALGGRSHVFPVVPPARESDPRLRGIPAPPRLELRIGAQVMLIRNLDVAAGLVNGSRGVVRGFDSNDSPVVEFRDGTRLVIRRCTWELPRRTRDGTTPTETVQQFPLRLSWALTIHKAQVCGACAHCNRPPLPLLTTCPPPSGPHPGRCGRGPPTCI